MKKAAHLAVLTALAFLTADQLQHRKSSLVAGPSAPVDPVIAVPVDTYLKQLAIATWPDDLTAALNILHCESRTGTDPNAWRTDRPDGGPYQLNRTSWEQFFLERYGWTWTQITHDPAINTTAARIIYNRTGDWRAWSCSPERPSQASPAGY